MTAPYGATRYDGIAILKKLSYGIAVPMSSGADPVPAGFGNWPSRALCSRLEHERTGQ